MPRGGAENRTFGSDTVPYLASTRWYSRWFAALLSGAEEGEARRIANSVPEGGKRDCRRWSRVSVDTPSGDSLTLSLPLGGGSSAAKRLTPDTISISSHGDWQRIHLGALDAAYGRMPYYRLMEGELRQVLQSAVGKTLSQTGEELHSRVCRLIGYPGSLDSLRERMEREPERLRAIAADYRRRGNPEGEDPEKSFWKECFRFGPSVIFRLLGYMVTVIILFVAGLGISQSAQAGDTGPERPRIKIQYVTGRYGFIDQYGDSVQMTVLRDLFVYPPMKFKNKKQEEFYWRTVRDVRKTLPYAKLAFATLCETYEYIQTIPDKKERERHLKRLEKEIFAQYKPAILKMTRGQGKVLLKLINRETDQTSYSIVKAFLGSFRAGFWQTFGKFFGMNMKSGFHPESSEEDAVIDRVATLIEQGAL